VSSQPLLQITPEGFDAIVQLRDTHSLAARSAKKTKPARGPKKPTGEASSEGRHDKTIAFIYAKFMDGRSEDEVLAMALSYNEQFDVPEDDDEVAYQVHYTFEHKSPPEVLSEEENTWRNPVNLSLLDDRAPVEPTLAPTWRMLYPGKRHTISGLPETLKTMIAYAMSLDAARAGSTIAILNFEMDPYAARDLFRDLGASDAELSAVEFYSPESAPTVDDIAAVINEVDLVVIDAGAGMYGLEEADDNRRGEVDLVLKKWVGVAFHAGVATVVLEHAAKAGSNGWAIGSERKIGVMDVHHRFEIKGAPLVRGQSATLRVHIEKDRPGYIRRAAPRGMEIEVVSDPFTEGLTCSLSVATTSDKNSSDDFRPTTLMERASKYIDLYPGTGKTDMAATLGTKKANAVQAVSILVNEGYLRIEVEKNKHCLYPVKPYRKDTDETSFLLNLTHTHEEQNE
jgi:AAA domain